VTEEIAEAALARVAEKLGGGWRAVDGSVWRSRSFGLRDSEGFARKRFRLEYGDNEYAMTFCHGDTWRQALDDYVRASGRHLDWYGIPEEIRADSAEELVLKLAVAGEIRETPDA
jgi:hypothetical protein